MESDKKTHAVDKWSVRRNFKRPITSSVFKMLDLVRHRCCHKSTTAVWRQRHLEAYLTTTSTRTLPNVRRLTTLNLVVLILTNARTHARTHAHIPFTQLATKAQFPQRRGRDYSEETGVHCQRPTARRSDGAKQEHASPLWRHDYAKNTPCLV